MSMTLDVAERIYFPIYLETRPENLMMTEACSTTKGQGDIVSNKKRPLIIEHQLSVIKL